MLGDSRRIKNGFKKKIRKSHKRTFCTRTPINHTTQEVEVEVGIVVEETEEEGATQKREAKERRTTLILRVTVARRKANLPLIVQKRNKTTRS